MITGYEKDVYKSLLAIGISSVKDLTKHCKVPITAIYPTLATLEKKGMVKKYAGPLATFQAIEPKLALETLSDHEAKRIAEEKEDLLKEFSIISKPLNSPDVFSLSIGTSASLAWLDDIINKTSKTLYIFGWRFTSSRSIYSSVHQLNRLSEKNIDVRIIFNNINEKTNLVAKECIARNIPVRYLDIKNFSMIISDKNECKLTMKGQEIPERINIHFREKHLVCALQDFYISLWEKASIYK